jgi:outer membrane protein TolC
MQALERADTGAGLVKPVIPGDAESTVASASPVGEKAVVFPAIPAGQGASSAPAQAAGRYSLEECRAAALGNNCDLQAEVSEEIARMELKHSNLLKTLPHPIVSAEFGSKGAQIWPYTVQDEDWYTIYRRGTWRYILEMRWSPTDSALSWIMSRSDCNNAVKARLQRVRTAQKLLSAVEGAYFRLLALQECMPLAERLVLTRSKIAEESQDLAKERLTDLDDYHRREQKAAMARHLQVRLRTELERQRAILTITMGFPPQACGTGLTVIGKQSRPHLDLSPCELETHAIRYRPETEIEGLNRANSHNETLKTVLRYFPKATAYLRYGQEGEKQPYKKDLRELGALVHCDLLEWISNFREHKAAQALEMKSAQRAGAIALAIMSDVRLNTLRCLETREDLANIEFSLPRTRKQLSTARGRERAGALEKTVVDDLRGDLLQEEIEQIRLTGEANARLAELACSMGTNYTEGVPRVTVPCLTGRAGIQ